MIAFSSTDKTCALALRSDQVRRRRFFTFSITSGQNLRRAAASIGPVGLFALGVGAAARIGALTSSFVSLTSSLTTSFTVSFALSLTGAAFGVSTFAATGCGTEIFSRSSNRSILEIKPTSSLPGRSMRPQISSSINRGAVAPRIWVKPAATISALRIKLAVPIIDACVRIRCN